MKDMKKILKQIPRGKVITYAMLAKLLNTSPRAVGHMLAKNDPKVAPCYKVVRSDGFVGGYSKGVKKKIELLEKEGIEIKNQKIDLKKHLAKVFNY